MKDSMLKALGIAATAAGVLISIGGGIIADKKLDATIAKKVSEALAEKN